jgi:hypothetical protein
VHQEEDTAHDFALSAPGHLPVTARRLSQKVLLILLRGDMWVRDPDGGRREIDEDRRAFFWGPGLDEPLRTTRR